MSAHLSPFQQRILTRARATAPRPEIGSQPMTLEELELAVTLELPSRTPKPLAERLAAGELLPPLRLGNPS